MRIDGSIEMQIPLGKLLFKNRYLTDVFLEHDLVNRGFGECESIFIPRPLVTFLDVDRDALLWHAPSGVIYRCRRIPPATNGDSATVARAIYRTMDQAGAMVEICAEGGGWEVRHEGFSLFYRHGSLVRIQLPDAGVVDVVANGKYITRLLSDGVTIVSATWRGGRICDLNIGNKKFVFTGAEDRIESVICDAAVVAGIGYDRNGLIRYVEKLGASEVIEWKRISEFKKSNNSYKNPFYLARCGDAYYSYHCGGNRISLAESTESGMHRSLVFIVEGARLRVIEKSPGS